MSTSPESNAPSDRDAFLDNFDPPEKRRPWALLFAIPVLIGLVGVGAFWYLNRDSGAVESEMPYVGTYPDKDGSALVIPNVDKNGNALPPSCYDGSKVRDGHASKEFNPKNLECPENQTVLTIPIAGPCPIEPDGAIGAPDDYTTGCYYESDEGGLSYLGHSVRGERVGAFERINELEPGQIITAGGHKYEVAEVGKYPADNMPSFLWKKGHFNLITCYLDAAADAGGKITSNVVVTLNDLKK